MSEEELERWQQTGEHAYRCERAGIVFLRIVGDVAEEDVAAFFAAWERFCEGGGRRHVFWLIDLAGLGAILPEARKLIARTPVRPENKGTAIFGASFQQRAVATLVDKALSLLQPNAPPVVFFRSEAEARAWIEGRRRKLARERR